MNYFNKIETEKIKVNLISTKGKEKFYMRYGFNELPNNNFGAGMTQFIKK